MNRRSDERSWAQSHAVHSTRRAALREIARHSGAVLASAIAFPMVAAAVPLKDCKFYCKKKANRKSRQRCNDRCNKAAALCHADPTCIAEQVCGQARCMTIC